MSLRCKGCDRKLVHLDDDLCTQCRRTAFLMNPTTKQISELVPREDELDMFIPEEEKEAWKVMMGLDSSG